MRELTYEDWSENTTPRMMWVWDSNENNKQQRKVIYFIDPEHLYPIIALDSDEINTENFKHCAEIEKSRRMTYQELSWWLTEKPHREYKDSDKSFVYNKFYYSESQQDESVPGKILIRENGGAWKEPLIEVTDD